MDITSRPSLNRDAIRLLKIAEQHCYSENFSGLIIEITTVFLHSKTAGIVPTIAPVQEPSLAEIPEFEPLPEDINLDGISNLFSIDFEMEQM